MKPEEISVIIAQSICKCLLRNKQTMKTRGNDTMSASSKKKLRAEENTAKLTEKQLAQQKEDKKVKIYTAAFAAVLVILIAIAAFTGVSRSIANSGSREKKTVALTLGDTTLSNADLSYYYMDTVNNFYSQNGAYAMLYGLDTSKALDQQVYDADAGTTWADYFLTAAEQSARAIYAVANEAQAQGYTLSESEQSQLDSMESMLQLYAQVYGFKDVDSYLKAMYGNGSSLETYKEYYRLNLLASGYQAQYRDNLTYTADQVKAKDAENPASYNSYTYNQYYISASRYLDENATAEEKAAAAEADAKTVTGEDITSVAKLDAAIAALPVNAETSASSSSMTDQRYTSVNSLIAQWISDSSRKEGDKTYIASTSTTTDENGNEVTTVSGYYVVYFISSNDNSFPLVNVRHILSGFEGGTTENGTTTYSDEEKAAAKEKAEAWLDEWESGAATEESFAELAKTNSTDTGSKENGGLYEDVYPGQMVSAFNNWCFDSSRKPGDTGIVETTYGYHVMYFVGAAQDTYREYLVKSDLASEDYSNWYNTLVDSLPMTVGDTSYMRTNIVLNNGTK